jgi:hypothetical protein
MQVIFFKHFGPGGLVDLPNEQGINPTQVGTVFRQEKAPVLLIKGYLQKAYLVGQLKPADGIVQHSFVIHQYLNVTGR